MSSNWSREEVRLVLRAQAIAYGFPADWFDAIARHESNYKLDAVNNAGPDAKYGGSYGPMQMLKTNIERLGFTVEQVTSDPYLAGEAAAKLMQEGNPQNFEDAVAWWNSGHKKQSQVPAGSTEHAYLADITANDLKWVRENQPT